MVSLHVNNPQTIWYSGRQHTSRGGSHFIARMIWRRLVKNPNLVTGDNSISENAQ